MKKFISCFFIFAVFFSLSISAFALKPTYNFYVNDYANIIDYTTESNLSTRAKTLDSENGVQVVVVTVNNYIGESMEKYANEVFNDFGIGKKGEDNGILLIVAVDDGEVRIEVGDGLSGLIPDSKAGEILDTYFMPSAKNGDFNTAINSTYLQLIKEGSRYESLSSANSSEQDYFLSRLFGILYLIIIYFCHNFCY